MHLSAIGHGGTLDPKVTGVLPITLDVDQSRAGFPIQRQRIRLRHETARQQPRTRNQAGSKRI